MEKVNLFSDNIGGISKIYVISPECVSRIIENEVTNKSFLVLKNRNKIFEILADEDFEFKEIEQETDDGISYNTSLEGFISKIDKNSSSILEKLVLNRWMLVHQDGNGEIWLSGSKEFPLTFSYSRTSGKRPNDRNCASFILEGVQANPSVRIEDTYI